MATSAVDTKDEHDHILSRDTRTRYKYWFCSVFEGNMETAISTSPNASYLAALQYVTKFEEPMTMEVLKSVGQCKIQSTNIFRGILAMAAASKYHFEPTHQ